MVHELGQAVRSCFNQLQRCVEKGGVQADFGSCWRKLRVQLEQDAGLDPSDQVLAGVKRFGHCLGEVELLQTDTMHVSHACMGALKTCQSHVISSHGSQLEPAQAAQWQLLELKRRAEA
eukprot:TRINITY_DN113680_c0_g1_i1.p1 TRINITY_DN113680_c0_g1~~TRINITY_DN113680_c0_g1_i1.p1  ORF type:complete len:119 (-),score=25.17 TRINITY_DN113680_c0_g1_i1:202-558(-)